VKKLPLSNRRFTITALLFVVALLISVGSYSFFATTRKANAAAALVPHPIFVNPQYSDAGVPDASGVFLCQTPAYTIHCYGPKQFQNAYTVTPLLNSGIQGQGSTIVIIDAYQSPTIVQDLATFSKTFNLPAAKLNIIHPDGIPAWNPNDTNMAGWGEEISLDVQWSHALAPRAKIVLVEAKSNQDADLLSVTKYAVNHNLGDVISQSFGEGESCADPAILKAEHEVFQVAAKKNITVFASAGDSGSAQPTCDGTSDFLSASTPASDPLVTGVGGTQLVADLTTGKYTSESVWNETVTGYGAGGGGYSKVYTRPDFQDSVTSKKGRGVPDVAFDAAVNGGVLVAVSYLPSGKEGGPWHIFGGTSASSPEWAGLIALGDQLAGHRLGFINDAIYNLGRSEDYHKAFHDITVGNNTFVGTDSKGNPIKINGFSAKKGWDAASGWGSPIAANLLPLLEKYDH
jgi:subtilase family serine protease